jgi:fatty-acyl-CoA synthase
MVIRIRLAATAAATLIAIATPLLFLAAALGSKHGLWDWRFGLGVMTRDWGPPAAIAGMVVTALSILLWVRTGPRWPIAVLVVAFLAPALCLYGLRQQQALVLELPAIHDVNTDWSDPVQFTEAALEERMDVGATNPVLDSPIVVDDGRRGRWAGMTFAEAQAIGYPDLASIELALDLPSAQAAAIDAMRSMNLDIRRSWIRDDEAGVEAVATTAWYGLQDDVAVRLRSTGRGTTLVDVRSISREGHIDLGENAERVRRLMGLIRSEERRREP